ncbi:hypothetical protein ACHAXM_012066 [Skeletonema potamos]
MTDKTGPENDLPKPPEERNGEEEAADDDSHGPKYQADQKVLCIDTHNATSDDVSAPLYEAVIRKSELKRIDPTTRKILPDRKRGRGRGRVGASTLDPNNELDNALLQEWCHHVHFNGWNSRWDRWVTERDIFGDTAENRKRVSGNSGKVARSLTKPNEDAKDKKRKRGTAAATNSSAESSSSPLHFNLQLIQRACELPFTLKTVLLDDRDKVTIKVYPPPILFSNADGGSKKRQQRKHEKAITMLHIIPAPTSIVDLLGQYIQTKKQEDLETFAKNHRSRRDESCNSSSDGGDGEESNLDVILTKEDLKKKKKKKRKEFALSILALLDASLPLYLLYAEERDQFTDLMAQFAKEEDKTNDQTPKRQPSHLYPAEYLLRLFMKIPYLLSEFDVKKNNPFSVLLSNEKSQDFAIFLSELIIFLQTRVDECFQGNYQVVRVGD